MNCEFHPPPAAILLAAGASSRMGTPKALLPTSDNLPLAARQLLTLHDAGYSPLLLVTGRHDPEIRAALSSLSSLPSFSSLPITFIYNPDWPQGRLTSVHAALRALQGELEGRDHAPVRAAEVHGVAVDARVWLDRRQEGEPPPFRGLAFGLCFRGRCGLRAYDY